MIEIGKTYKVYPEGWDEPYLFEVVKYIHKPKFNSGYFTARCSSIGGFYINEVDYPETIMLTWQKDGFMHEVIEKPEWLDEDLFEI